MPLQGSNLNSSESKSDVLPITPRGITNGGPVRYRSSPANGSDLQSDCRSHRLYRPKMVLSEPSIVTTDLEITKNSTW